MSLFRTVIVLFTLIYSASGSDGSQSTLEPKSPLIIRSSLGNGWQRLQLGEGGPILLMPPGAVSDSSSESVARCYAFHVRVSENRADEEFRVLLVLDICNRPDSVKLFNDLCSEDERSYGDRMTWKQLNRSSFTWIRKDGIHLKELRKLFIHPTKPNDFPVRELRISCPQRNSLCDRWMARIESSFRAYPEEAETHLIKRKSK